VPRKNSNKTRRDIMPKEKTSKAQVVRDYISQNPKAKAKQVVEALTAKGIQVTDKYVWNVKSKRKTTSTKKSAPKKKKEAVSTKRSPWTFPKNLLEEAIRVPQGIEEKNAGNPMQASVLAKAVGFRKPNDWRFLDLLRSANQYGLVSGAGKTATIKMEKLGQDIVVPGNPKERQEALLAAFHNVSEFKSVAKFYGDKKIPEDEFFLNTLTRQFKIPRDRVETFSQVFVGNLEYLRAFDVIQIKPSGDDILKTPDEKPVPEKRISKQPHVRSFLDTCFVMMPFGDWFDKYYQEIYASAIREAGFEPVRADELFATGTVVEQIWEQIKKAKVLLADLTDRNANVFYELGLAHAAGKPVVFIAPKVEDVPYDLRHLRVILYEVREPEWATALHKKVTDYLKNAIKDKAKSIPHPFRVEDEEE